MEFPGRFRIEAVGRPGRGTFGRILRLATALTTWPLCRTWLAMIIAIDGPAASGKGTLGKRLAHHYGYRHLDTGVIYRAVAKALLDERL